MITASKEYRAPEISGMYHAMNSSEKTEQNAIKSTSEFHGIPEHEMYAIPFKEMYAIYVPLIYKDLCEKKELELHSLFKQLKIHYDIELD